MAHLFTTLPVETMEVQLYGRLVQVQAVWREIWLRDFSHTVKVVVAGIKEPILLFSTGLSLSMAQIIELYGARFTVELAIRDLKGHFGLADYQCYVTTAIHRFVHLACLAFCLYRLIHRLADPPHGAAIAHPYSSYDLSPVLWTWVQQ